MPKTTTIKTQYLLRNESEQKEQAQKGSKRMHLKQ